MKRILKLGALGLLLFSLQSCEEKGVNFNGPDVVRDQFDTTYTAAVEAAQGRNVLIEEFTGASCTNCPDGHATVASIETSNPDRVVAIAYHTYQGSGKGGIFAPVHKPEASSKYDFRDSAATQIAVGIYGGFTSIPLAGIDRTPVGGTLLIGRAQWPAEVTNRLSISPAANISLNSSYSATDNKVTLKVKINYTKAIAGKNVLTLGVLESGIVDAQEYPDHVDPDYVHNHVFRKCLSLFNGNPVLDNLTTKEAGRVYEYTLRFTPEDNWNLDNCNIIAFLSKNEGSDKEVIQAAEVHLK